MLQAYYNFWNATVSVIGKNPYILAYDLLNEPWPGGFYEFPEYLTPGLTDFLYLEDLYSNISNVIRNYSTDPYLAIEPTQLPDTFTKYVFPVGFTKTPYHRFLNDHSYCCEVGPEICENGEPSLENATTVCRQFHKDKVEVRSLDAERLEIGLFFTEFGACSGSEACVQEILGAVDAFDSKAFSWSYWQYKGFNDITTTGSDTEGFWYANGTLQEEKVKALSRTYFQAVQGKPISMKFDNGEFFGTFELDSKIKYPTEIYINRNFYYPNGFLIDISKEQARISNIDEKVFVFFNSGFGRVNITISPA